MDLLCRNLDLMSGHLLMRLSEGIYLLLQNIQLSHGRVSLEKRNTPKMRRKKMVELRGSSRSHRRAPSGRYREAGRSMGSRARVSVDLQRSTVGKGLSNTARLRVRWSTKRRNFSLQNSQNLTRQSIHWGLRPQFWYCWTSITMN